MSEENVELVRRAIEELDGDRAAKTVVIRVSPWSVRSYLEAERALEVAVLSTGY